MNRQVLIVTTLLATVILSDAARSENLQVGKLDCDVSSGIGAIVGSKQDAACTFEPSDRGEASRYVGKISSFGLDIGTVEKGRLVWLVYAPTRGVDGDLAGTYRGLGANASLGVGLGANVLASDGKHSFTLQPLSIEGEQGINVAVGVSEFKLRRAN